MLMKCGGILILQRIFRGSDALAVDQPSRQLVMHRGLQFNPFLSKRLYYREY